MKRRAFLGFLGGAAVAGPHAAKSAAQMSMADLQLSGVGLASAPSYGLGESAGYDAKGWAKEALGKLTGRSAMEMARRKREFQPHQIDPNVASLRSVTLVNKIRVSRDMQFEQSEKSYRTHLEGIIAGWWE